MKRTRFRDNLALLIGMQIILCVPVILDLLTDYKGVPFRYFAADTFYYLVVARNWANQGMFTFDQIHPTNGFHPVWQLLTALIYRLGHLFAWSDLSNLILIFLLSVGFISLGLTLVALSLANHRGRLSPLFLAMPVGVYALVILPFWVVSNMRGLLQTPMEGSRPLYGTMWSFMNGMESCITIAAFGAMALCFSEKASRKFMPAALLGLMAALLTLSRLDHIFIAIGVLFIHSLSVLHLRNRTATLYLSVTILVFVVPILLYILYNAIFFGALIPLSGATKSTFPYPHLDNLKVLVNLLRYPFNDVWWLSRFFRSAQILVPCLSVVIFAAVKLRNIDVPGVRHRIGEKKLNDLDRLLLGTGIGIIALALYNFFFVNPWGPGHWYFPISILYVTISTIVLLPNRVYRKRIGFPGIAGLALLCVTIFFFFHRRLDYHARFIDFYFEEAPRVKAYYGSNPPRIIEYDDGIIAYSTGFPSLSGFGLAIDKEAYQAIASGQFIHLALDRGFDRAASLVYTNFAHQDLADFTFRNLSSSEYRLWVDYQSEDGEFSIIKITERELHRTPTVPQPNPATE